MPLKKFVGSVVRKLARAIIITWYKLVGPPRILRFGWYTNAEILRAFGAQIGNGRTRILAPLVLHNAGRGYENLTIGDNCILNGSIFLDLAAPITLEEGVGLGPGVTIMTHNQYNYNDFLVDRLSHTCGAKEVLIKRGASIKAHSLIVMGVTVGEEAVVAGGSVVNRDIPSRHLVAGVPARIVTEIF